MGVIAGLARFYLVKDYLQKCQDVFFVLYERIKINMNLRWFLFFCLLLSPTLCSDSDSENGDSNEDQNSLLSIDLDNLGSYFT